MENKRKNLNPSPLTTLMKIELFYYSFIFFYCKLFNLEFIFICRTILYRVERVVEFFFLYIYKLDKVANSICHLLKCFCFFLKKLKSGMGLRDEINFSDF